MATTVLHAIRAVDIADVLPQFSVWRCTVCGVAGVAEELGGFVMRDGSPYPLCSKADCIRRATEGPGDSRDE
jgi:hypothetical protein